MTRELPVDIVRTIGGEDERWRFYRGSGARVAPREAALAHAHVFADVRTVKPDIEGEVLGEIVEDEAFPEVSREGFMPRRLAAALESPFTHKEPVRLLECRSILSTMETPFERC